jgi:SAM-dependent methyltransferase
MNRVINSKANLPPLHLRQLVGSLYDFEGSIGEYTAYLKLLCKLRPGDRVLDLGCGCGTILYNTTGAGSLLDYLGPSGLYVGMDIDALAIEWCQRRAKHIPNCIFTTSLKNIPLLQYDVVIAKSLFTHLLDKEAQEYLKLVHGYLRPGGACLSTWFLLNFRPLHGEFKFPYDLGPRMRVLRPSNPTRAVAYLEEWLLEDLHRIGFETEVLYGTWPGDTYYRGDNAGLSFQDIIVLRRKQ